MTYTIPPDTRAAGQSGHIGDHDNIADVLIGNGLALNVLSAAWAGGADPAGSSDSTAAINAALNAAAPGQVVIMPPGVYKTTAPLIVPPYVKLAAPSAKQNVFSLTPYGTVIKPAAGWAQGAAASAAVILLQSQSAGGYATVSEEQVLENLTIDGSALVATADGIGVWGNVGAARIRECAVNFVTGIGLHGQNDAGGHGVAGVWEVSRLTVRRAGLNGISFTATDATWTDVYVIGSGQKASSDGWVMGTSSNTQLIGCRSEDSLGGTGFTWTSQNVAGNGFDFVGCSTQGNAKDGFLITATSGNASPVTLTGCRANEDGVNGGAGGGGFAGFAIRSTASGHSCITLVGCKSTVGTQFTTGAPVNGLVINTATGQRIRATGCLLWGLTNSIVNDASAASVDTSLSHLGTGLPSSPTFTG